MRRILTYLQFSSRRMRYRILLLGQPRILRGFRALLWVAIGANASLAAALFLLVLPIPEIVHDPLPPSVELETLSEPPFSTLRAFSPAPVAVPGDRGSGEVPLPFAR